MKKRAHSVSARPEEFETDSACTGWTAKTMPATVAAGSDAPPITASAQTTLRAELRT